MDLFIITLSLGVLSTLAIDAWSLFVSTVFKFPKTNWAMVGRWIGHMRNGKLTHQSIAAAPAINNELVLGWIFHYLIGIAYAGLYVALVYFYFDKTPSLISAWLFGVVTIVSPWFIMQPGLGLGICARKAANPKLTRLQNLAIHSIFGVALYYSWVAVNIFL